MRNVPGALAGSVPLCVNHAGDYAATLHDLKAVASLDVQAPRASGTDTLAQIKAMPKEDDAFGAGAIRADGCKLHPFYLFEADKPEECRGALNYYKLLQTTPAGETFRPPEGGCPLIRS